MDLFECQGSPGGKLTARGCLARRALAFSRQRIKDGGLSDPSLAACLDCPKGRVLAGGGTPCSVKGCGEGAEAEGMCRHHFWLARMQERRQTQEAGKARQVCLVEGCEEPAKALGRCKRHYYEHWRERRKQADPGWVAKERARSAANNRKRRASQGETN